MNLTTATLTTATPAEIDAELSKLQSEVSNLLAKQAQRNQLAANYAKRNDTAQSDKYIAQAIEIGVEIDRLRTAAAPLNAEFNRRGGWTRAFLVITSGQGHVHRTMSCTTCYPTTQFHWLTELSDHDEQEIVDLAGEAACTVCYKSAPVQLRLDRPRALFTEDEKRKQAERQERTAKRAAADAAKITVKGHSDFGRKRDKEFKTARAVTNMIASELTSLTWYGTGHPSAQEWVNNVEAGRKALAQAGVDYDYDKALAAARKKAVRDGRTAAAY